MVDASRMRIEGASLVRLKTIWMDLGGMLLSSQCNQPTPREDAAMAKGTRKGSVPANDPMFSEGPLIVSIPRFKGESTTAPVESSAGADLPNPMQEVEDGMEAYLLKRLKEAASATEQAGNTPSPQSGSTTEAPKG
jgi:hypothetical protein